MIFFSWFLPVSPLHWDNSNSCLQQFLSGCWVFTTPSPAAALQGHPPQQIPSSFCVFEIHLKHLSTRSTSQLLAWRVPIQKGTIPTTFGRRLITSLPLLPYILFHSSNKKVASESSGEIQTSWKIAADCSRGVSHFCTEELATSSALSQALHKPYSSESCRIRKRTTRKKNGQSKSWLGEAKTKIRGIVTSCWKLQSLSWCGCLGKVESWTLLQLIIIWIKFSAHALQMQTACFIHLANCIIHFNLYNFCN